MSQHANTSAGHGLNVALETLHYTTPAAVVVSFVAANATAACYLHQPPRDAANRLRRTTTILLFLLTTASFVAQAVSHLAQSLTQHGYWASQDSVIYILGSIFVYGMLALSLLEAPAPLWYPCALAGTVALMLEVSTTAVNILTEPTPNAFAFTRLALQISRSLALLALCLVQWSFMLKERHHSTSPDGENEPLLGGRIDANGTKPSYQKLPHTGNESSGSDDDDAGSVDSDMDDPAALRELKRQQKERLEKAGSWINYLKEFKIFLRLLWPSGNRFVQLCLAAIGLVIIAERFLNVLVPRQLGIITDELTKGYGEGRVPWNALWAYVVFSLLQSRAGIHMIQSLAEMPVEQFTYKALGAASFGHIMGLSADFHNSKNSGELIRAVDQGHSLQYLLELGLFRIAPLFIDLGVAFVYVYFLFDIYMSFILVIVGVGYIWVGARTTLWSVKRRRRFNATMREESKVQNEAINNWQTVSHFNRGEYECERYGKVVDDFTSAQISYYLAYYLGGAAQTFIMQLGRLSATFLAVYRVSKGTAPIGHLITLEAYWGSIEAPLSELSWSIRKITSMLTDSERLLQLFQTKASVTDAPGAVDIHVKEGHVEFQHVQFSYDPRKPTLKDVSFVAKPGQTIALCGETGGGKSTVLKLLYRYYDVSGGSIRIDGQDIRDVTLRSLRAEFGMVPQDPALFNVSLRENLRYARLDATDGEIEEACRAAAIHDKILSFPDGYEATVGERGVKLSGGELQRVAIARAILRQPKIVILDEATSQIDAETETVIQEAFKKLSARRTTFVIAHRLSTIQDADLILVIQDGEVIQRGTHDELFKDKKGKYVALWSKQLRKAVQEVGDALRGGDDTEQALIDLHSSN